MKSTKVKKRSPLKLVIAAVVVVAFAAIGATIINKSSAATPSYVAILGPSNAVIRPGVSVGSLTSGSVDFMPTPQVIYVGPGATLRFDKGVKGNVTHCYQVQVIIDKGSEGTAKVYFAGVNNAFSEVLAVNSTDNPGALRQVCVSPGKSKQSDYNVYNASTNTGIFVLQDVVSY